MDVLRCRSRWLPATLGLALAALSGCQTWTSGETLPSGRYLQHPPQYFPPSPAFPLTRELASQETINAAPAPDGGAPGMLPPAVPGAGGGGAPGLLPPAVPGAAGGGAPGLRIADRGFAE
jgi:hypothetical protein